MSDQIYAQLATYLLIALTVTFFIVNILLTLFDIRLASKLQQHDKMPSYKNRKKLALIVVTQNSQADIEECIQRIYAMQLRSLEIHIIDNASTDNTKQLIQHFQKNHPKFKIHTTYKRTQSHYGAVLTQVRKKVSKERVLIVSPATAHFSKTKIYDIQKILASDQSLMSFAVPVLPYVSANYVSVLRSYEQITAYLLKKCASYCGIKLQSTSRENVLVHTVTGKSLETPMYNELSYSMHIRSKAQTDSKFPLNLLTSVFYIIWLIAVPYFVYVAVRYENTQLLLYSLGLTIGWLFIAGLAAPGLKVIEKIQLTISLPIAYVLLYIRSGITVITLPYRLKNIKLP